MWKCFSDSLIGRSHEVNGTQCQDKTLVVETDDGFFVGLADGAGSATHSDVGAVVALNTTQRFLFENFDNVFSDESVAVAKKKLVEIVLGALRSKSEELDIRVEELASTLLFVACKGRRIIVGHIGDGCILIKKDQKIKILSSGVNGEFANTTYFTTSPQSTSTMFLAKGMVDAIDGFFLMSDGCEFSLVASRKEKIAPVVGKVLLWNSVRKTEWCEKKVKEILEQLKKRTFDDCSIAGVIKKTSFHDCTFDEKCMLLNLSAKERTTKKIRFWEDLTEGLRMGLDKKQISLHLHLKKKHLNKRIRRIDAHFLDC